jgi:hypothetical protein
MSVPELPTSLRSWMSAVTEIVRAVNADVTLASAGGSITRRMAVAGQ